MIASNQSKISVLPHRSGVPNDHESNVVERLQNRIESARAMGFDVRREVLGDNVPTWCEVAGRKMMFLDISQTASEQLQHVEQLLGEYQRAQ